MIGFFPIEHEYIASFKAVRWNLSNEGRGTIHILRRKVPLYSQTLATKLINEADSAWRELDQEVESVEALGDA